MKHFISISILFTKHRAGEGDFPRTLWCFGQSSLIIICLWSVILWSVWSTRGRRFPMLLRPALFNRKDTVQWKARNASSWWLEWPEPRWILFRTLSWPVWVWSLKWCGDPNNPWQRLMTAKVSSWTHGVTPRNRLVSFTRQSFSLSK